MGFRNKTQGPDFFEDFTSQARQLVQAVEFLTHIYAASPEERIALRDQLHEVEHRGDELNHDIVQGLESCADAFEELANVIESLALKES